MSNRDELAEKYALERFPVQMIPTVEGAFPQAVNFARRLSTKSSFCAGWDARDEEVKRLREAFLKLIESVDESLLLDEDLAKDWDRLHTAAKDARQAVDKNPAYNEQDAKIAELTHKLEVATEALEFYADKQNWTAMSEESRYLGVVVGDYEVGGNKCGGMRAREVLKEIGEKSEKKA